MEVAWNAQMNKMASTLLLRAMKQTCLVLTVCFLSWPACAQEKNEDEAFLDFIKADPKATPAQDLPTPTPSQAMGMLKKWKAYEAAQIEKLNQAILDARKIACEMLTKKALSATAGERESLLKISDKLSQLPADTPLGPAPGRPEAQEKALLGAWEIKNNGGWWKEFKADGIAMWKDGGSSPWRWIDPEAGVLSSDGEWSNLYWIEKPGLIRLTNKDFICFTAVKVPTPPALPVNPVVSKLNASETSQRAALSESLDGSRKRVVAWLLDKARVMHGEEATELVRAVRQLETEADEKSDPGGRLAGVWHWDRNELLFRAQGLVTSKEGRKLGRWGWTTEAMTHFAVVLNGGKAATDIYLAPGPSDPRQTTLEAHRITGGKITATRTLP